MLGLRNLEVLENKVELGIHPGKLSLNLTYSVLKSLDALPLLLETSITVIPQRDHQGLGKLKENFFLHLLSKCVHSGWHPRSTAWPRVGVNFLLPCTRYRGD